MAVTHLPDYDELEAVTARAREIRFGETVLRVLASILFTAGWAVAKIFSLIWYALVWAALAFAEGWSAGRTRKE